MDFGNLHNPRDVRLTIVPPRSCWKVAPGSPLRSPSDGLPAQLAAVTRRLEARDTSARRYKEAARALKARLAEAEAARGDVEAEGARLRARVAELEAANSALRGGDLPAALPLPPSPPSSAGQLIALERIAGERLQQVSAQSARSAKVGQQLAKVANQPGIMAQNIRLLTVYRKEIKPHSHKAIVKEVFFCGS